VEEGPGAREGEIKLDFWGIWDYQRWCREGRRDIGGAEVPKGGRTTYDLTNSPEHSQSFLLGFN
jgi:hypothetical protein